MADMKKFFGLKSDREVIKENEKWFKFFVILPMLNALAMAICCFVCSIVLIAEVDEFFFSLLFFGTPVTFFITYYVTKVSVASKILKIYYLKKISNFNQQDQTDIIEEDEELPEI